MKGLKPLIQLTLATMLLTWITMPQAHAYGNLTIRWALVDTDNCREITGEGNLPIQAFSNGCELDDSWDGTFFEKDPGGEAIKVELHDSNGLVAKVEWHPYGEYLWVYDTRSDGDTVYVTFFCFIDPPLDDTVFQASREPMPTIKNFEIAEGIQCSLEVFDDSGLTDSIFNTPVGAS